MATVALTASAAEIAAALTEIDKLLLARSHPLDDTIRTLRGRIEAAQSDALAGTGPFDELHLLDTLTKLQGDWYTDVQKPGHGCDITEARAQHGIYLHIADARGPLKDVRNSYPAFDPPPEALKLEYWFKKPPTAEPPTTEPPPST